jgi:hypothetical protein
MGCFFKGESARNKISRGSRGRFQVQLGNEGKFRD